MDAKRACLLARRQPLYRADVLLLRWKQRSASEMKKLWALVKTQ